MEKWMKRLSMLVLVVVLAAVCMPGIFFTEQVQAADQQMITLKEGVTYKKYDITGDGKADKIRVKSSGGAYDYHTNLTIKINGKTAYKLPKSGMEFYETDIKLLRMEDGTPYLYVYAWGDDFDGPLCAILQYQKKTKKLTKAADFLDMFENYGYHNYGEIASVKGNKITAYLYSVSYSLGVSDYQFIYTSSKGKLKCKNKSGKLLSATGFLNAKTYETGEIGKFAVNKSIRAYSKAGGKKISIKLKKGNKVSIDKIRMKGKTIWIHVKKGGKSGWIKALKDYPTSEGARLFSNIMFAG